MQRKHKVAIKFPSKESFDTVVEVRGTPKNVEARGSEFRQSVEVGYHAFQII